MRRCLWHSVKWAEEIIEKFYLKGWHKFPLKLMLKLFLRYVRWKAKSFEGKMGLKPVVTEAPFIRY